VKIERIKLTNYKSIHELDLTFGQINIMIGGNGAGNSNLISYFKLLNRIINQNLSVYVARNGGANSLLYFGRKVSQQVSSEIIFSNGSYKNAYSFTLEPDVEDRFYFSREYIGFDKGIGSWTPYSLGEGKIETQLFDYNRTDHGIGGPQGVSHYIINAFKGLRLYHFHDTSDSARVKQIGDVNDNRELREDAANLAAFLYKLKEKHSTSFQQIESTIRRVAPFFQQFDLKPNELSPDKIRLEWLEKGSNEYFNASSLSDGTLRMICLVTLLLQPQPPDTIIIDEPELGLHPTAIHLLASIIKSVASRVQIIISTQSVTLINQFLPEDLIVVERADNQSVFRKIDSQELTVWLDEYALGELWEKNVLGGRP
jgi:predicted ATPase